MQRGYSAEKLVAFDIMNDSMNPSLIPGDSVLINLADTMPVSGRIYAASFEGETLVRRLHRDGTAWWLVADNPNQNRFPRIELNPAYSAIVGRTVLRQTEDL